MKKTVSAITAQSPYEGEDRLAWHDLPINLWNHICVFGWRRSPTGESQTVFRLAAKPAAYSAVLIQL